MGRPKLITTSDYLTANLESSKELLKRRFTAITGRREEANFIRSSGPRRLDLELHRVGGASALWKGGPLVEAYLGTGPSFAGSRGDR